MEMKKLSKECFKKISPNWGIWASKLEGFTESQQMTPSLWQKQGRTKGPLDESERGENIWKMKIMASGPTTSLQIDGETVETVRDLFWGAPESLQMVTAAMKFKDACSLEEKLWPT